MTTVRHREFSDKGLEADTYVIRRCLFVMVVPYRNPAGNDMTLSVEECTPTISDLRGHIFEDPTLRDSS